MSPTIVGGLRARLIHDSLWQMLHESLRRLEWFDAPTEHGPVTLVADPVEFDKEVPLNTLAISELASHSEGAEMGSDLEDDTTTYFVDFFAENDALGRHVNGDVRDILRGKFHSIGRVAPILIVRDWQVPAPHPVLFICELQDVVPDRAHNYPHPWQRHWFSCRVDIVDTYSNDIEDQVVDFDGATWSELWDEEWGSIEDLTWEDII